MTGYVDDSILEQKKKRRVGKGNTKEEEKSGKTVAKRELGHL